MNIIDTLVQKRQSVLTTKLNLQRLLDHGIEMPALEAEYDHCCDTILDLENAILDAPLTTLDDAVEQALVIKRHVAELALGHDDIVDLLTALIEKMERATAIQ